MSLANRRGSGVQVSPHLVISQAETREILVLHRVYKRQQNVFLLYLLVSVTGMRFWS